MEETKTPVTFPKALFQDLYNFIDAHKKRTGDVDIYLKTDSDPSGYLSNSPFWLTFDGGEFYYAMNNHSMFGWGKKEYNKRAKWVARFHKIIEKHGYYAEMGTSWAMGFYLK